ncbi:hypothetical protein FOL47_009830 [Perkinsus chesapeaki]|uniref:Uncharacterized protein n=1 Tax=Perkinsus chesapeaki TaxID=330153 RepID=A0A7J6L6C8_PERCH|nr:hypothetical protein FOL47_009830 [Perkinsus chesapeaki]
MHWNCNAGPVPGATFSQTPSQVAGGMAAPAGGPSAAEVAVLRGKIQSMEQEMQSLRAQRDGARTVEVENERLRNQIISLQKASEKERADLLDLKRKAMAAGSSIQPPPPQSQLHGSATYIQASQGVMPPPRGVSPRGHHQQHQQQQQYSQFPASAPYNLPGDGLPVCGSQCQPERPPPPTHTSPIPSSSQRQLSRHATSGAPTRSVKPSRTVSEASMRQVPPISERKMRFIERAVIALHDCRRKCFQEGIRGGTKTEKLQTLLHMLQRGDTSVRIDADCQAEILSLGNHARQFLECLALLVPVDGELLGELPVMMLTGSLGHRPEAIDKVAKKLIEDGDGQLFFDPLRSGSDAEKVDILRLLCRVLRGAKMASVVEAMKKEADSRHSLLTLVSELIDPAEAVLPSTTALHVLYFFGSMAAEDSIEYVMSARSSSPGGGTRPNIACRVSVLALQLSLQEMEFRTLCHPPGSGVYQEYRAAASLRIDLLKASIHLLSSLAAACLQKRASYTKGEIPAECKADCKGTSGTRCDCLASYFGKYRWVVISLLSALRLIAKDPLGHSEPVCMFTSVIKDDLEKDLKLIKEWLRSNGDYELDTNLTLGYAVDRKGG